MTYQEIEHVFPLASAHACWMGRNMLLGISWKQHAGPGEYGRFLWKRLEAIFLDCWMIWHIFGMIWKLGSPSHSYQTSKICYRDYFAGSLSTEVLSTEWTRRLRVNSFFVLQDWVAHMQLYSCRFWYLHTAWDSILPCEMETELPCEFTCEKSSEGFSSVSQF